jgi:hypothetical protein
MKISTNITELLNSTTFYSIIGLRFNWREMRFMQIGGEDIENLLVNMMLEKKTL